MNKTNVLLVLSLLFSAITGCNSETPEQRHDREITQAFQQGAHDPVDWSARNNRPIGKMDRKNGLTHSTKAKD